MRTGGAFLIISQREDRFSVGDGIHPLPGGACDGASVEGLHFEESRTASSTRLGFWPEAEALVLREAC